LAETLTDWLTAHGYSCDSGTGSSGRLKSKGSGKTPVRSAEKPGVSRASAAGSDLARAKRILADPSPSAPHSPGKPNAASSSGSSGAHRRVPAVENGGPKTPGKLPKAKPIEEELEPLEPLKSNLSPVADFLAELEQATVSPLGSPPQMMPAEIQAYLNRRKGVPGWLWAFLGAASLLAFVLLVILLLIAWAT